MTRRMMAAIVVSLLAAPNALGKNNICPESESDDDPVQLAFYQPFEFAWQRQGMERSRTGARIEYSRAIALQGPGEGNPTIAYLEFRTGSRIPAPAVGGDGVHRIYFPDEEFEQIWAAVSDTTYTHRVVSINCGRGGYLYGEIQIGDTAQSSPPPPPAD